MPRWILLLAFIAVLWGMFGIGLASPAVAQQSRQMPKPEYYSGFGPYYQGDYKDALRIFRSAYNSAFRVGDQRFVDSVCILTMMGECYYQVGDYATAMQHYNEAVELYMVHHDQRWQQNIRVPATLPRSTTAVQRAGVTWGTSARRGQVADVPDTLSVLRGRQDANAVFSTGGNYDPAEIRPVNVTEIMRCLALSIRRRGMINGPAGKFDPLSLRAVAKLRSGNVGNGSYLGALNGVAYGMALASVGETDKASAMLKASLQFSGNLDHPLTSLALLQLGETALLKDKPADAGRLALEASYSAAWFSHFDRIEESLGLGTQAHLFTQRNPYPPLANAITWAKRERADMLEASLRVRLAECFSEGGDFKSSDQVLKQTGGSINRRNSLNQSIITSRIKYLGALNEYLAGKNEQGAARLEDAIKHLGTKSRWLYRLRTADALVVSGGLTDKQADALYELTLQDPGDLQWKLEPMEAIAFLVSPHVDAMQRWFTIAINRKQTNKALQIADAVRRHRFFSTLPLGGRLLSLRWVLHGDPLLLSQNALQQRQKFLTRYAGYRGLLNDAQSLRAEIELLPIQPATNSPEYAQQKKLVSELVKVSSAQESQLASIALRREPADLAFPPRVDPERISGSLEAGQLALVTLQTSDGYHIFALDSDRTRYFGLVSSNAVKRGLVKIFDAMGVEGNFALAAVLKTQGWKAEIAEFQERLLEDIEPRQLASTKELIVVPDGLFWYLPIESFFVDLQSQDVTFGEAMSIRYCPTLSLAFAKPIANDRSGKTGIVAGTLYPKTDEVPTTKFADQWLANNAQGIKFSGQVIFPSSYFAWQLDQLVTLQQNESKRKPFDIKPMAIDTARFGTTLFDWMKLPQWAPDTMVMPGLNAVGGPSGRLRADGSDLFLTSTALMAAGSRSLLLSRWNTGGQLQMELAGRFANHSRSMPMTAALKQSIAEVKLLDVVADAEPRINFEKEAAELKGDQPFIWSSQILVALPETNVQLPKAVAGVLPGQAQPDNEKDGVMLPGDLPAESPMNSTINVQKEETVEEEMTEEVVVIENPKAEEPKVVVEAQTTEPEDDDDEGAVWQIGGKK